MKEYDYNQHTVIDLFNDGVKIYGDKAFLQKRTDNGWVDVSWNQLQSQIQALASYLINYGVKPGEILSIYSQNRPEWVIADYATLSCGCADATIYPTNSASEAAYIINDTKSAICFCEGQFQVDNMLAQKANMPSLKRIIVFDQIEYKDDMVISMNDVLKDGENRLQTNEIAKRVAGIKPKGLMTLIYSSGTTGQPKGVMLSHSNIMYIANTFARVEKLTDKDLLLSLLPLSHAVERTMSYYAVIRAGGTIAFSRGIDFFAQDLTEIRPTIGIFVPRVFEKIYNGIMANVAAAPTNKQKLFAKAVAVGKQAGPYLRANEKLPIMLKLKYKFFDKMLYSKLKTTLGFERTRVLGAAGAPLLPEIHDFFWGLNMQIRKGYGLTETAPTLTVDGDPSILPIKSEGWITPFPEAKLKIAEDGEILAKSPGLMLGYLNMPEQTKEMFTSDGWLMTGDIGVLDSQGYLKITDRKKDIIVTSGGKNVAPQVLENTFASNPFIEQIAVVGDGRNYIVALIVPNFDTLNDWAGKNGIGGKSAEQLVNEEKVLVKYRELVNEINQNFGRVEQIKNFKLMPQAFTLENGELTPTLKLKRKVIINKYQNEIDALYK